MATFTTRGRASLLVALVVIGCAAPPDDVPQTAAIAVTPTSVQFGLSLLGERVSRVVHYGNVGERPVIVDGAHLIGSPEFAIVRWYGGSGDGCEIEGAAVTFPTTMLPGAGLCAEVTFVATGSAVSNALLELDVGADLALRDETRVVVFGQGKDSHFEVVPDVLDFGTVVVGQERTLPFAFRSTRKEVVEITDLSLEPVVDWFEDDVDLVPPSPGPVKIEPGQPAVKLASLRFSPSQAFLTGKETLGWVVIEIGDDVLRVAVRADVLQSRLDVEPGWIDFGHVAIGGAGAVKSVVFQNRGQQPIEIANLRIEQDELYEFESYEPLPSVVVLNPGRHVSFTFTAHLYDGIVGSLATAMLRFDVTGAGDEPPSEVPLIATRSVLTYCALRLEPEELSFGAVPWENARTLEMTLKNIGTASCRLDALSVATIALPDAVSSAGWCEVPESWAPDEGSRFQLGVPPEFLGETLTPFESRSFLVRFVPGDRPDDPSSEMTWGGLIQARATDLGGMDPAEPSGETVLLPSASAGGIWPCNLLGFGADL